MLGEHVEFFRQFRTQFHTTGAIAPSGRALARAMTRHLNGPRQPARILEVGPGTGAVTRRIVRLLRDDDQLDLVELNTTFANLLERRFRVDPAFQRVAGRARVHVCGIESFRSDVNYDFIVSGLPFNNFSPAFVEQVLQVFFGLLAPSGVVSFFEYMGVRPLRRLVAGAVERDRLADLDRVLGSFLTRHRFRRDWVFVNIPPAWVQHLRRA
jgi:phosphatidylethanolamine/phosphatidyl-N-methylethanolamine N-methyltransferase